jgi:hypothetical protein
MYGTTSLPPPVPKIHQWLASGLHASALVGDSRPEIFDKTQTEGTEKGKMQMILKTVHMLLHCSSQ